MRTTVLHLLCANEYHTDYGMDERLSEIRALIAAGWDVNAKDRQGATPLHHAMRCRYRSVEIVRILIDEKADVNACDTTGFTPLLLAHGDVPLLKILIEAGADVNPLSPDGPMPLSYATCGNGCESVNVLLDAGADVNAVDYVGQTALHCAARCNEPAMKTLLRAGANPNVKDGQGRTPLSWARTMSIARALIRAGALVDEVALQNTSVAKVQAQAQQLALAKPNAESKQRRRA